MIGFTEGGLIGSYFACSELVSSEIVDGEILESGSEEDCVDGVKAGAAITGAMVGALSATATRSSFNLSTGDAVLVGSGAFWGLLSGSLFYKIFDSEYRLRDPMLLVGMNLGIVAATGLVANSDVSLRRIAVIDLAGTGGLIGGVGIARALATRDDQTQHYALLGLITGLVGGTFLTRSLDDAPAAIPLDAGLRVVPGVGTARDLQGNSVMSFGVSASF